MTYETRKPHIQAVESLRGRTLVSFLNFDRISEPEISGLKTVFHADAKAALFRVLKESKTKNGIDLFLYTRGGDINAVWALVSLIREFDRDFQVLVPFRCHSSGTLAALGADKIVMGPLSELSPIDPTTGNQFNPKEGGKLLGISVEDVTSFRKFISSQLNGKDHTPLEDAVVGSDQYQPFLQKLTDSVHPLALGNVQRVLLQIRQLAEKLLQLHPRKNEDPEKIIDDLTTKFYSHLHMINRLEAKDILGDRVVNAPAKLTAAMDNLLRSYEEDFNLRRTFYLTKYLGDKLEDDVRFVGGLLESTARSYLFVTQATARQRTKLQPNVQVQVPAGQALPLIAGLPKEFDFEVYQQGWEHNTDPKGVTL